MADESSLRGKYFWILITGLVSLVVGVSGGLILNRLTVEHANLEYELKTSAVFTGKKENIAILAIDIRNPGKKEIEDLVCRVDLKDSALQEPKVTGLPTSSYTSNHGVDFFQLTVPFLNPSEQFSIQLLLGLPNQTLKPPVIQVRGKGLTARERSPDDKEKKKDVLSTSFAAAISTMIIPLIFFLVSRFRPGLFYTKKHRDDQRDVLAYILAINGFFDLANSTRQSERRQSYWSIADALTEQCLVSTDEQIIRRGVKALLDLVEYASMADTSQLLIHYDIARLAARIPDESLLKEHLSLARKGGHKVIEKRIKLDQELSAISSTTSSEK